jgi:hypothetical protein
MIGFAVVMVLLTLALVILSIVFVKGQNSYQRYGILATPESVEQFTGTPGEAGALMWGELVFDSNSEFIGYSLRYLLSSTIVAVHVRGPVTIGTGIGPIKFSLCGTPSTVVCDITSTPGNLEGTIIQISPGDTSVHPEIDNVRLEPHLYYVEVLTSTTPVTPGALRAPLLAISGSP